jgi:hypothetical protein
MMRKSIYKVLFIVVFAVFLIFTIQLVLFTPTHVSTEMSVDTESPVTSVDTGSTVSKSKVAGLIVQFRDGITKKDAMDILDNHSLTLNKVDYDVYDMPDKYYIIADQDKITDVKDELTKENWIESYQPVEKGNYYITAKENYYVITISEQDIKDKNLLAILEKYNLQVKKFVYCHIHFSESPGTGISQEKANELKSELEKDESIFTIYFESIES